MHAPRFTVCFLSTQFDGDCEIGEVWYKVSVVNLCSRDTLLNECSLVETRKQIQ